MLFVFGTAGLPKPAGIVLLRVKPTGIVLNKRSSLNASHPVRSAAHQLRAGSMMLSVVDTFGSKAADQVIWSIC